MKIKNLSHKARKDFKILIPDYQEFLGDKLPHLATTSLNLYTRALSFISIINNCNNKSILDTCIYLVKKILTDNNLKCIVGNSTVSGNNKNIRLSSFKNLVEIFKDDINDNISSLAYNTTLSMLGKVGGNIRKKIKNEKNNDDKVQPKHNWVDLLELNNIYLKKYLHIKNQYIKTNEVPDYVFLRDCLVSNLYLNNTFTLNNSEFNVILRNEYKSLYLHIGDEMPTSNQKNYFWIKLNSTDHKIIINKNKTTGGISRSSGGLIGHTHITPQKNQKIFPLSENIVEMILLIKQIFNERPDKPFIKCNNRELNYTSSTWVKMLQRIFKTLDFKLSANAIRKIYQKNIDCLNYTKKDISLIYHMNDLSRDIPSPVNNQNNTQDIE